MKLNTVNEYPFLCVDDFLQTHFSARALTTAFEAGLIDIVCKEKAVKRCDLKMMNSMPDKNSAFLLGMLVQNHVIQINSDQVSFTPEFQTALRFRDLLEVKLQFANWVCDDFHNHFTQLLTDPAAFMKQSNVFELFRYDLCFETSQQAVEQTKRWMHITTTLTRYEAQAVLDHFDFTPASRLLDIGGNSGEMALQICKKHNQIEVDIFDLPLVCEIGKQHVDQEPEAERIRFIPGDLRKDNLPSGYDMILMKSFLHDWPPSYVKEFIRKASSVLKPGGTIIIVERNELDIDMIKLTYAMLPNLLFINYYRTPDYYINSLNELQFLNIQYKMFKLEMPFFLLTAQKHFHDSI